MYKLIATDVNGDVLTWLVRITESPTTGAITVHEAQAVPPKSEVYGTPDKWRKFEEPPTVRGYQRQRF